MADLNERDTKLVQYLSEAHSKEQETETSLQAHIEMTTKPLYKKRLQQHLKETKSHSKQLERRVKKLGGGTPKVGTVVAKGLAAAKGPLHMARGGSETEKMLKNAKTEYFNEHEEIATYRAIEVFADKVGDKETAKLAKDIRREEERMAKFLDGQIKQLTGAVVTEEVPRSQRASTGTKRRRKTSKRSTSATKRSSSRSASSTATKGAASRSSSARKSSRAKSGSSSRKKSTASSRKSKS